MYMVEGSGNPSLGYLLTKQIFNLRQIGPPQKYATNPVKNGQSRESRKALFRGWFVLINQFRFLKHWFYTQDIRRSPLAQVLMCPVLTQASYFNITQIKK